MSSTKIESYFIHQNATATDPQHFYYYYCYCSYDFAHLFTVWYRHFVVLLLMDELTLIFNYHFKDMQLLATIHSFCELPENVVITQKKNYTHKKSLLGSSLIDEELVIKSLVDGG